jgi:hypothetical protein
VAAVDFSDLIPAKPSPAAAGLFDDLIPKQTGLEGFPEEAFQADYAKTPLALPQATFPGPPANEPPPPRWQEDNPTFAVGDPQQALPRTSIDLPKIGGAMREGWRGPVSLLPPGSDEAGQERLWGPYVGGAINTLARIPLGIPNALTYGAAEFANQATGDPRIGRDVNLGAQVMAALLPLRGRIPSPAEVAVPPRVSPMLRDNPRFMSEHFAPNVSELDPRNAIETLIRHDIEENPPPAPDRGMPNQGAASQPPPVPEVAPRAAPLMEEFNRTEPPPVPPVDPPVPGSVGAAASREGTPNKDVAMDFDTMKANRRRAELDELRELPTPGDKNIYVEGSFPTLAEQSADPTVSQVENMLRERRAGHFIGEGKPITEANKARVRALDNEGIPDTTLDGMRKDRAAEWIELSRDIIPKSKPADLTAIERWVDGELADPRIKERDAVFSVLKDLKRRLYDENGALKSDPGSVWGLHDQLQDMLKKAKDPLNQTSVEAYSNKEILIAKKHVDDAMNVASDRQFQRALDAYAKRSQEIRAGEIMNELRDKAVNMHGEVLPQKFHSQVLSLAKDRGDPGIDPSMDITDKGMRTLLDIDKDLKRAGLIKMGAPRQSQTNLMGYLSDKLGAEVAKKFVGAIPIVGKSAKEFFSVLDDIHLDNLAKKHTSEPEGGYTRRPTTED